MTRRRLIIEALIAAGGLGAAAMWAWGVGPAARTPEPGPPPEPPMTGAVAVPPTPSGREPLSGDTALPGQQQASPLASPSPSPSAHPSVKGEVAVPPGNQAPAGAPSRI